MALDFLTDKKEEQGPVFSSSRGLDFLTDKKPGLVDVYNGVMDADPVKTAKVISFARKLEEPEVFVEKNLPEIEKSSNAPTMQYWAQFEQNNPKTAAYLANPKNMASAKDVIDELGELEQTFKKHSYGASGSWEKPGLIQRADKVVGDIFKGFGMAIPAGMGETVASGAKLAELGSELMGGDKFLRPWWSKYIPIGMIQGAIENLAGTTSQLLPEKWNETPVSEIIGDGISDTAYKLTAPIEQEAGKLSKAGRFTYQIAKPIPNIVLSGTTGAALATGLKSAAAQGIIQMTPFALSAAGSYAKEAELDGASPSQQAAYGTVMGIMEGLTEKIPFDTWFKIGGKVGIKTWIKSMTVEGLQELIIDPIANITKKFMDIVPDMPWTGEGGVFDIKQMGESFAGGAGTGVLMAGGSSIANRVLSRMMNNYDESTARVDQAKNDSEVYKQIGEAAANSQYLERLPEGFRELVKANTEGGKLENVYIDTEPLMTLFQDGQTVQMVAEELGIGEQLQEAIDTNKPLKIPYAVWIEKVAKTPLYKKMEQHVKFSEEGLTLFQAQEEEKRIGEMVAEEQKQAEKYIKSNESMQLGYDAVYSDIKEKLLAVGRSKVEAEAGAKLWASRATAESVRRNINPVEWYMGQNKPEVRTEEFKQQEGVLNQAANIEGMGKDNFTVKTKPTTELLKTYMDKGYYFRFQNPKRALNRDSKSWGMVYSSEKEALEDSSTVLEGKSAVINPTDLVDYIQQYDDSYVVLVFDGERTGYGHDGELAVKFEKEIDVFSRTEFYDLFRNEEGYIDKKIAKQRLEEAQPIPENELAKKKSGLNENPGENQGSTFYQTDSQAFKNWFGDSKVVDEQGKPLVVYHGTKEQFEAFDKEYIGTNFNQDRKGFFFTNNKKSAEGYANNTSYGTEREKSGVVLETYLSIKNPFIHEIAEDPVYEWDNMYEDLLASAENRGSDGIIIKADSGENLYVAFEPTQIKSIDNQGTFDPGNPNILMQDINAQVNINKDSSVITLFKTANASSFLHESAHLFLNDTFEFVRSGQADEEYLTYWNRIAKHLDVKEDQESLTIEQQEKFAREFEAYLREGKAPSEGLRKAFSAFRRWLTRIYRDISGLNAEVSDEVREIMDRMLATEEEIREREVYNGYDKDLIKESDVSPATWKKLQELKEKAHEMAIQQLLKPQMDELKPEYNEWLQQERENVRKVIEEEVGKLPHFQVMEAVRMSFGQQKNIKDIAQRYTNKAEGITNEGIAKFEAIADAYGYTSGDHLARTIVNSLSFADEVNGRVEEHMAQYMDLRETANIKYEAEIAVRNDERLDLMALEQSILFDLISKEETSQAKRQRALERSRIASAAAKRYARATLADKPYREAQAATSYFAAERNAAVKEAKMYNAKDYEKAAKYAEQRILNHALAVEALKVKGEVEKSFKYLDKWQKQKRPDNVGQDHLNQIDKILNRFGMAQLTQNAIEDKTTLNEWIDAHTSEDYDEAAIPPDIANEAFSKSYKDLTLGELRDLVTAVKNIETVARNENRLLTDDQNREFKQIVESLVVSIGLKNKVNFPKSYDPNQTAIDKAKHYLRGFVAAHKKVEYIVRALDGYKDQGPLWDLIVKPMVRGMDMEYKMRAEMGSKLEKIYRKHYGKETNKLAETKIHVEEVARLFPKGLTKENVLAMALNWGTESNKLRLIDSYNETIELTPEDVKEIIQDFRSRLKESEQDSISNYEIILKYKRDQITSQIKAVFRQAMTEKDWDFTQSVWDFIGSYWPQIAADKKIRTGVEPAKIEAASVETPYNVYPGGYYPVTFDPSMSEKASRQKEEDSLKELFNLSFMKPSTRRGFEKARVETVLNRPLDLHLSGIDKHLSDVAHSVAFTNGIRDADKLLNNFQVQKAIKEAVGDETYKQFRPWLQGIAREGRDTVTVGPWSSVEKILSRARIGSSIVNMGLKMTTAFSQIAGIVPVMDKIGAKRTAAGVMEFYKKMITGKAQEEIDFVFSKSEMMKNRMNNRDRDIKDATRKLLAKNQLDEIKDTYFSLTGLFDYAVTFPAWIASYNKSIEEQVKKGGQLNEETAIRYADLVVRETQGSGDIVNMAAVQRGTEIQKLLTQFYSYFSVYANRQIEAFDRAKRNGDYSQLVSFAMYWWFLPAVMSELLAGRGPDDDDEAAGWWGSTLLKYPASAFIVLRDFSNALGSGFDFELSPSTEAFAKTVQFLNLIPKTITGDAEPGKLLKSGFEAGGYWLQYPSKQISTTVGNIYSAMVDGEDFYLRDLFFPKPRNRR